MIFIFDPLNKHMFIGFFFFCFPDNESSQNQKNTPQKSEHQTRYISGHTDIAIDSASRTCKRYTDNNSHEYDNTADTHVNMTRVETDIEIFLNFLTKIVWKKMNK